MTPTPHLPEVLTAAGFTSSEISSIESGKLMSGVVESLTDRELAAKFACTINAPVEEMAETFMTSKREHDPNANHVGSMDELDDLKLEPNRDAMAKLYINGDSSLNLSNDEVAMFKGLKTADEVEQVLRRILKARYEQYLELGLDGIPGYSRGRGVTYEPGPELKLKSQKASVCEKFAPHFFECLNQYPHAKPEHLDEAFSWVNFTIDEKPTICLVHKFGVLENGVYVFCQRHFYVSRGHNSVQGIGGAFPRGDKQCAAIYGSSE